MKYLAFLLFLIPWTSFADDYHKIVVNDLSNTEAIAIANSVDALDLRGTKIIHYGWNVGTRILTISIGGRSLASDLVAIRGVLTSAGEVAASDASVSANASSVTTAEDRKASLGASRISVGP